MGLKFLLILFFVQAKIDVDAAPVTSSFDPKTNLKNFIKVASNLDTSKTSASHINGTIYGRRPGFNLQKLFYFEGFNIARKVPQPDGSYHSLSCELLVYRDLETGVILRISVNPFSSLPNEVFVVANYPVNGNLTADGIPPAISLENDIVVYDLDIPLQYPNPLPPDQYPKYSAGPVYVGAELFQFFGKGKEIADPTTTSANLTSTWTRVSQWLPWMEMGKFPGLLWYSAISWKMTNGIKDLPADIYLLLTTTYPKFMNPPTDFEIPNETSWTVFKKIIDSRRAAGQPDIIFPDVQVKSNVSTRATFRDPKLESSILAQPMIKAKWNGSVYSLIEGQPSVELFKFRGNFVGKVTLGQSFMVRVDANGNFADPMSGKPLVTWFNPITNNTVTVPPFQFMGIVEFSKSNVQTTYVPPSKEIGLIAVNSFTHTNLVTNTEDWYTDSYQIAFRQEDIAALSYSSAANPISFYGTWTRASSWLTWMDMAGHKGEIICRFNIEPDL